MHFVYCEKEPYWKSTACIQRNKIPEHLHKWLFDQGSLTTRLKEVSKDNFSVQVESQNWCLPQRNERLLLSLRPGEYVFVRQVYLLCNGKPWVFARTVIPVKTANGPLKGLTRLGSKSLGSVLFNDPTMERNELELTRITSKQALFKTATQYSQIQASELWGRRSKFELKKQSLLVSEIFLPDLQPNQANNDLVQTKPKANSGKSSFWELMGNIFGGKKEKGVSA